MSVKLHRRSCNGTNCVVNDVSSDCTSKEELIMVPVCLKIINIILEVFLVHNRIFRHCLHQSREVIKDLSPLIHSFFIIVGCLASGTSLMRVFQHTFASNKSVDKLMFSQVLH